MAASLTTSTSSSSELLLLGGTTTTTGLPTMRALTYSWIGLSAAAPLIFLICAWVLGVFHGYRRHWRSVDLFLLAVFVQELIMALQVFAYSLLSLMRPESAVACGAFVWSLSATRTLQAATVVSLLVDRMLTSQWPYKYRFSVRRHQIRYHLVVLATIAALVGVAAILARPADAPDAFEHCSFLPHALHTRLALLMLSIYGIMLVGAVVCIVVVQGSRGCSGGSVGSEIRRGGHMGPHHDLMATNTSSSNGSSSGAGGGGLGIGGGGLRVSSGMHHATTASTTSTTSSNASSNALGAGGGQLFSSTSDLIPPPLPPGPLPNGGRGGLQKASGGLGSGNMRGPGPVPLSRSPASDFRWGTTLAVAALCFLINHLPYVAMTIIGTFFPVWVEGWPLENMSLWLSLAEGLFLPLLLGLVDPTFSHHAGASCCSSRQQDEQPINNHQKYEDGVGPFRLFPRDEVKSFPLTNGSLFSSLLNMNMDNPQHNPHHNNHHNQAHNYRRGMLGGGLKMGVTAGEVRGLVRSVSNQLGPRYNPPSPPYGPPYYVRDQSESLRTESMASVDTTSQDPIYSDPLGLKVGSADSSLKDDHIYATLSETFGSLSSLSDGYLADDQRCSSVTTVANDDFEFRTSCMPDPTQFNTRREHVTIESRQLSDTNVSAKNVVLANRPPAELPSEARKQDEDYYKLSTNTLSTSSSPSSSFRSGSSQVTATIENTENIKNKMVNDDEIDTPQIGYFNKAFECDTLEKKRKYFEESLDSLPEIEEKKKEGTLSRKHRSSSLSMNDLDSLTIETEKEEEMMFILPVKSESMLSLYRLYLAEDEENNTNLHYSMEVSRSEGDLSALSSSTSSMLGEGKSEGALHEVYQKRRAPEVACSRIKRQHKIQRAKGLQQRSKMTSCAPTSSITNIHETDNGSLQVTVTDKSRRRNGIITIRDPSVLSVDELFKVLERATTTQTVPYTNEHVETTSLGEGEFKKIFVSEYI